MQFINTIKKNYLNLTLLVLIFLIKSTKEDLPVHCLKHELINKNKNKINKKKNNKFLTDRRKLGNQSYRIIPSKIRS